MKRHRHLFEQIVDLGNIYLAAKKSFRGKKFKHTAAHFYFNFENEVLNIQKQLIDGSYQPKPYRVFKIYEPKERNICSADFCDRVVHHAIMNILWPLFERRLINETYACREGKGVHSAIKKSQNLVRKYNFYLKCDVKKYFESIDHVLLKSILERVIKDKKLQKLLDTIIAHQPPYTQEGKGLPIGNLTSQHFANIYLGENDLFIKHKLRCKGYIRYMDDFILFSNDKNLLWKHLERIRGYLSSKLNLELKERLVRIAPVSEGLPFLGHRVFRRTMRLQRANMVRFRRKIKDLEEKFLKKKIVQEDLINSVRSCVAHVSHGNTRNLRNALFFR